MLPSSQLATPIITAAIDSKAMFHQAPTTGHGPPPLQAAVMPPIRRRHGPQVGQ